MRDIRQHVNPLGLAYQTPRARAIEIPASSGAGHRRVEVELGCADAKFSFDLAAAQPDTFVVGLEIREAVVDRNQRQRTRLALENLEFAYVNLNVDLDRVFRRDSVDRFHLLFPDPWFKRSHHKRRVVDPEFLAVLADQLRPGGEFHFASDVWEIALEALAICESDEVRALGFTNMVDGWSFSRTPPLPVFSRRELTTRSRGGRVWRMRYRWAQPPCQ